MFLIRLLNRCSRTWIATIALSSAAVHGAYDTHPKFDAFTKELAEEYDIPSKEAKHWLSQAEKLESVLSAIQRPAEKTINWDGYQDIFLTKKRLQEGKVFIEKHRAILEKAEQEYGVPKEIITAILGVETYYGTRMGRHRVLDSLATLAFDYPQRKLFWRELKALFALSQRESLDLNTLKGSYAGAMGYGQFIPTSYLNYAVDGDGDGKRDLLGNSTDAIMSVANYFKRHGWRTGEAVASTAAVTGKKYQSIVNDQLRPKATLADVLKLGVSPTAPLTPTTQPAALIQLEGKQGTEHWVTLYNFYVITRYNHSRLYAMAVFQLSEQLR